MNRVSKITGALLVMLLLAAMTGCSGSDSSSTSTGTSDGGSGSDSNVVNKSGSLTGSGK